MKHSWAHASKHERSSPLFKRNALVHSNENDLTRPRSSRAYRFVSYTHFQDYKLTNISFTKFLSINDKRKMPVNSRQLHQAYKCFSLSHVYSLWHPVHTPDTSILPTQVLNTPSQISFGHKSPKIHSNIHLLFLMKFV